MNDVINRRQMLGLSAGIAMSSVPRRASAADGAKYELRGVRKIWDSAPHNAFTDLARRGKEWFCVFREGKTHVSSDGALRVLTSKDGDAWESAARVTFDGGDLRDAKVTVTPAGKLMLCGAVAYPKGGKHGHQSLAWFSDDGRTWSAAVPVGDPDYWLWRVTWQKGAAYGVGYGTADGTTRGTARLYRSGDGKTFEAWVPGLFQGGYPNESSLVFRGDETGLCLLRRDGAPLTGQLGISKPPYKEWTWKDTGTRIGGPSLMELPNGRLVAVVRLYDGKVRTSVCTLDPSTGTVGEVLPLPSGGDCSYAGLVWHGDLLWISYYSSHEGKTSIYLAKVAIG
ncbi:hypothetical protein [Limnoglobus roseus]|uniref:Putative beta-propeller-type glycoside hydrolase n=1 Tax=Limnoglobus roseus TaxID=2598579 RepID=A0A5C1ACI1_9BACT|nr:hypothetical protein [Limnoglobus roseus]QEL15472.1 putative beta-propeller-type glycoside hydrolase [Limnoglobus roseus]